MQNNVIHVKLNSIYEKSVIAIKIIPNSFAEKLITKGMIHFSSPSDWRDETCCSGKQLDIYEGSFLKTIDKNNLLLVKHPAEYKTIEDETSTILIDNDSNVYGCCFYTIKKSDFKGPIESLMGTKQDVCIVPNEYFEEFKKSKTREEYYNTPVEERDSVVLIFDFFKLVDMIKEVLIENGCSETEIFMGPVFYQTKQVPYFVNMSHPMEYFIKDLPFQKQKEFRIIINSSNKQFNTWLKENNYNVLVGDISNFCSIQDYYFKEVNIAIEGNKLSYELATPIVTDFEDFTCEDLMDIILQVNANRLPQGELSEAEIRNTLDCLEEILKRKFGVIFDRNLNKFYK